MIVLFAVSVALVSFLLTAIIFLVGRKLSIYDSPNERSAHAKPMPICGGLAIAISYILSTALLMLIGIAYSGLMLFVMSCAIPVIVAGLMDDIRGVSIRARLVVHFIAAISIVFVFEHYLHDLHGGIRILDPISISSMVVSCVGLVWFLNLFNFMDGIDGIAITEAIYVLSVVLIYFDRTDARELFVLTGVLVCACVGFLFWNIPPAKIFMGDVGSGFLGFMIGVICFLSVKESIIPFSFWLIICATFIVDATFTLMRRIVTGGVWYVAHATHAYQHCARALKSHGKVVILILCINMFWLLPLAILSIYYAKLSYIIAIVAYIPLILLALYLNAGVDHRLDRQIRVSYGNNMN